MIDAAVNVACQAFLKQWLRESMVRYPNRGPNEHTVPRWEDLSVRDRGVLQRAMAAALAAAKVAERAGV